MWIRAVLACLLALAALGCRTPAPVEKANAPTGPEGRYALILPPGMEKQLEEFRKMKTEAEAEAKRGVEGAKERADFAQGGIEMMTSQRLTVSADGTFTVADGRSGLLGRYDRTGDRLTLHPEAALGGRKLTEAEKKPFTLVYDPAAGTLTGTAGDGAPIVYRRS